MKKGITILLFLMLAGLIVLNGCAKPEEKPTEEKKLQVVAVFATPIEEPWDGCIHQALLKAKDTLGIDYKWVESVGYTDFERVLREYADKKPDIIMGDAFGNEEAARRVA
ncbi:MAG TPA: BMP family ABC transporter substrate-binding protein, partial [Caldisericia bacterium]|nr:BMP family ABC transporter substrate-binding protein [Caldisericia bacterium]